MPIDSTLDHKDGNVTSDGDDDDGDGDFVSLDVGGTIVAVERALVGLAPVGSAARRYLTPSGTHVPRFVDERPHHFSLLIDCLRHGCDALDHMAPYDADIVRAMLAVGSTDGHQSKEDAEGIPEPIVKLTVGQAQHVNVLRSTLCDNVLVPEGSPLSRIVAGDSRWSRGSHDGGGRLRIMQNACHFALLLDCLRHGVDHLDLVDSAYDLWGVRSLGSFYGLNAVRDAAQLAIGRREYLKEGDKNRCVTVVLDRFDVCTGFNNGWHTRQWQQRDRSLDRVYHSLNASVGHVARLAAPAVGAAPESVVVYSAPYYCSGWRVLALDDETRHNIVWPSCDGSYTSAVLVEPLPTSVPYGLIGSARGDGRAVPALCIAVDFGARKRSERSLGVVVFVDYRTRPALDTIIDACRQRDPNAAHWTGVSALAWVRDGMGGNSDETIDLDKDLGKSSLVATGRAIVWVFHGAPRRDPAVPTTRKFILSRD